jgi:hypothetical protein
MMEGAMETTLGLRWGTWRVWAVLGEAMRGGVWKAWGAWWSLEGFYKPN